VGDLPRQAGGVSRLVDATRQASRHDVVPHASLPPG
jgi:hypothetical protein